MLLGATQTGRGIRFAALGAGAVLVWGLFLIGRQHVRLTHWVADDAVIVSSEVVRHEGTTTETTVNPLSGKETQKTVATLRLEGKIAYRFYVGDQAFEGTRLEPLGSCWITCRGSTETAEDYRVGVPARIFYDPRRPEESFLTRHVCADPYLLVLAAAAAFGLLIQAALWELDVLRRIGPVKGPKLALLLYRGLYAAVSAGCLAHFSWLGGDWCADVISAAMCLLGVGAIIAGLAPPRRQVN